MSLLLVSVTPAEAFRSFNGAQVNPIDDIVFEVIPKNSPRTGDIWCAASEYARRVLGAGWRTRVYVVQGQGTSVTTGRRTAIQFTIYPDKAGVVPLEGGVRSGFRPGDSMTISNANGNCRRDPVR